MTWNPSVRRKRLRQMQGLDDWMKPPETPPEIPKEQSRLFNDDIVQWEKDGLVRYERDGRVYGGWRWVLTDKGRGHPDRQQIEHETARMMEARRRHRA